MQGRKSEELGIKTWQVGVWSCQPGGTALVGRTLRTKAQHETVQVSVRGESLAQRKPDGDWGGTKLCWNEVLSQDREVLEFLLG